MASASFSASQQPILLSRYRHHRRSCYYCCCFSVVFDFQHIYWILIRAEMKSRTPKTPNFHTKIFDYQLVCYVYDRPKYKLFTLEWYYFGICRIYFSLAANVNKSINKCGFCYVNDSCPSYDSICITTNQRSVDDDDDLLNYNRAEKIV